MATWSDKKLRSHKRAQGYLSSAGATLGVAALGSAALKSKGAQKAGTKLVRAAHARGATLRQTGAAKRTAARAAGSTGGLTTASAGVGGIGGFNFAGIQSQEAKKTRVRKMSFEEFAKARKSNQEMRNNYASGGALLGAAAGVGAVAAGTKLRPIVRTASRTGKAGYGLQRSLGTSRRASAAAGLRTAGSGAKVAASRGRRQGMTFDSINNATMGAGLGGAVGALSGDKIARNKIAAQKKTRVTKVLSPDVARSPFALGYEDVSKAFSPERSRHKRAEAYEKGAYAGSAGAVGATGYALRGQAKQAKTLATAVKRTGTFKPKPKVTMSPARQMPRAAVKNSALHIARSSAKPLAIGLGTAGALAVTGRAIGEHRKSKGRSYKALPLS